MFAFRTVYRLFIMEKTKVIVKIVFGHGRDNGALDLLLSTYRRGSTLRNEQ